MFLAYLRAGLVGKEVRMVCMPVTSEKQQCFPRRHHTGNGGDVGDREDGGAVREGNSEGPSITFQARGSHALLSKGKPFAKHLGREFGKLGLLPSP